MVAATGSQRNGMNISAYRWAYTPFSEPSWSQLSQAMTQFPNESIATDGNPWLFVVYVLTRNSLPAGPCAQAGPATNAIGTATATTFACIRVSFMCPPPLLLFTTRRSPRKASTMPATGFYPNILAWHKGTRLSTKKNRAIALERFTIEMSSLLSQR